MCSHFATLEESQVQERALAWFEVEDPKSSEEQVLMLAPTMLE